MAVTRAWKVYGRSGHRQKMSFSPSVRWDWSTEEETRIFEAENADKTGTHDYTIVRITCDSAAACARELSGQITDGYFENAFTGDVVEI